MSAKQQDNKERQALLDAAEAASGLKEARERIRAQEAVIQEQAETIERMRAATRLELPTAAPLDAGRDSYLRLIVPDIHGSQCDRHAVAALLRDVEMLSDQVREVVWLGDVIDCSGFLAQHHVLSAVAETRYTFEEDVAAAVQVLDRVAELTPHAEHHFIEGNHEARIEKWCVTQSLRNNIDAGYLLRCHGVEANLQLAARGWHHYKANECYGDCAVPATIRLGECYFCHGFSTAKNAAAKVLERFGRHSVVFGHIHRAQSASTQVVDKDGSNYAFCPGCLSLRQPTWRHSSPTTWTHGFALQLVSKSGRFLHVQVPIVEGDSLLVPLAERII